jgi:N-methylhydantoinase A/oxoprolinase/acetone carboxylase beta subunit
MEHSVRSLLREEGAKEAGVSIIREVEMCYVGQSFRLKIPAPARLDADALATIINAFHQRHADAYGFSSPNEPTLFVNLRLTGIGRVSRPSVRILPAGVGSVRRAVKGTRPVYFEDPTTPLKVDVYDRSKLFAGDHFEGPAIVEQMDTTVLLPPGTSVTVADVGSLIVSTGPARSEE